LAQPIARVVDDPTTRRLRELAAQEAAATKKRLAVRTSAAGLFSRAVARVAETKAAWERAQAEGRRAQVKAVEDLLGSGLQPDDVTELLGMSKKELRSLRAATRERPRKASVMNGSVALEAQSTHLAS
jgi:hypothetical protein